MDKLARVMLGNNIKGASFPLGCLSEGSHSHPQCVLLTRLVGISGRIMKESGTEGLPWGSRNIIRKNATIMGTMRTTFKTMKWENTRPYI